jgi:mono/diheme cytochrome c family protein
LPRIPARGLKGFKVKKFFARLAVCGAAVVLFAAADAFAQEAVPPQMAYTMFCATCHGTNGKGDGPAAATLSTRPRDFADCAVMAKIPDATVLKVIKFGGAAAGLSSEMPAWGTSMDDEQIKGLAKFVRTFCKK